MPIRTSVNSKYHISNRPSPCTTEEGHSGEKGERDVGKGTVVQSNVRSLQDLPPVLPTASAMSCTTPAAPPPTHTIDHLFGRVLFNQR